MVEERDEAEKIWNTAAYSYTSNQKAQGSTESHQNDSTSYKSNTWDNKSVHESKKCQIKERAKRKG